MIDDMSRSEIDQAMSSFIHSADSPCQSCPNREVGYCRFYQQELEEDGFGDIFHARTVRTTLEMSYCYENVAILVVTSHHKSSLVITTQHKSTQVITSQRIWKNNPLEGRNRTFFTVCKACSHFVRFLEIASLLIQVCKNRTYPTIHPPVFDRAASF